MNKRGRPRKEKNKNAPITARLRELGAGLTHQEIADGVGVARQTIGQFLQGNTQPDIEILVKLADFFNVSTDYLLGLTDVKSTDLKIQEISKLTGLSEAAIVKLSLFKKFSHEDNNDQLFLDIINRFIENI